MLPPTAMTITQVPVETTEKGGRSAMRCGSSEALESWMPQNTGVCGSSPVCCARSGRIGPSRSLRRRTGAISRASPSGRPATRNRPAHGFQRSVWQPSDVTSLAATPVSRKAQYCGYVRIAAALANSVGKALLLPEQLRAEVEADRQARRAGLGKGRARPHRSRRQARPGRRTHSRAPAAPGRLPRRAAPPSRHAWSPRSRRCVARDGARQGCRG